MSHDSHLEIDCNVSVIYCSSSSGNKVDLLSGTNMYTTVVVSDWCITNLAQGWWVSIQSIVGIFRGCWFPWKPTKILLPIYYSLTQLLSRGTNRIISKKWRNREGEPCTEKLTADNKWIMQWLWSFICHSLVPAVNIPEKTLLSVSCVGGSLIRSASFL